MGTYEENNLRRFDYNDNSRVDDGGLKFKKILKKRFE